jgi:lipoprotein-releasing system ATP-binding protein
LIRILGLSPSGGSGFVRKRDQDDQAMISVLEMRGVVKEYGGAVPARVLHGVDLALARGDFAALIGPSGSGKSTMLNLMGLLERPTAGEIVVDGRETARLDDRERTTIRGRRIGFVFQFHHLLKGFTALENVYMPMLVDRGRVDAEMVGRARELLVRMGLEGKEKRRADDLSGGEQQRVAIARALALRPALVLADEPTGNLDTETADRIFDVFEELNRQEETAWLIVTHDPRLADRCGRVVRIVDGRVVSDERGRPAGPCRTCGYDPRLREGAMRADAIARGEPPGVAKEPTREGRPE